MVVRHCVLYITATLLFLSGVAFAHGVGPTSDAFVRLMEHRFSAMAHVNVVPGSMILDLDCGCTVKYVGTRVNGIHYHIDLDKLD